MTYREAFDQFGNLREVYWTHTRIALAVTYALAFVLLYLVL